MDSFSKVEKVLFEDEFSSVTVKDHTFSKTFKSSEVIYLKYNNFALKGLLQSMCQTYEGLMSSAEKRYKKATGHKDVLKMETYSTGNDDEEKKFNDFINKNFTRYFNSENAVLPLPAGFDYSEPSTDANRTTNNEISDIQKLKNEAFNSVANALHIPPALLRGEASQLKDAEDTFIADAIDTITKMLAQAINAKCYGSNQFLKGNYILIDTTFAKHIDAISNANNLDKAIASSVLTPEQAQRYAGMLPSDEEFAKKHYLTKNYQTAEIAVAGEGGENNAE